jgi:hypothetical protein
MKQKASLDRRAHLHHGGNPPGEHQRLLGRLVARRADLREKLVAWFRSYVRGGWDLEVALIRFVNQSTCCYPRTLPPLSAKYAAPATPALQVYPRRDKTCPLTRSAINPPAMSSLSHAASRSSGPPSRQLLSVTWRVGVLSRQGRLIMVG